MTSRISLDMGSPAAPAPTWQPSSSRQTQTDIIFLDTLQFTTSIGPTGDCWGRARSQPVHASVYLHLAPTFLDACGHSDDVLRSVDYGHLAKRIAAAIARRERDVPNRGLVYPSVRALVDDIAGAAFRLVDETTGAGSLSAVRVIVDLPKQILLASGFSVEITTPRLSGNSNSSSGSHHTGVPDTAEEGGEGHQPRLTADAPALVRIKDLDLPVLIGVNPPERLARQRVITNVTLFEMAPSSPSPRLPASLLSSASQFLTQRQGQERLSESIDYPAIVQSLVEVRRLL